MGPPSACPYAVLGLAAGAPREEVKRAFRRLALRYHPDRAAAAAAAAAAGPSGSAGTGARGGPAAPASPDSAGLEAFLAAARAHEAIIGGRAAQRLWRAPSGAPGGGGGWGGAGAGPARRRLDRRVLAGLIVVPMAATGVWVGLHYAKIKQQSGRSLGLLAPPVNEFLDRSDPISLERLRRRRSG